MTANSTNMVYCPTCRTAAPREKAELARQSGQTCLLCGSRLPRESVWSPESSINPPQDHARELRPR